MDYIDAERIGSIAWMVPPQLIAEQYLKLAGG